MGDGSETLLLSSLRRRLVEGGVGEREGGDIVAKENVVVSRKLGAQRLSFVEYGTVWGTTSIGVKLGNLGVAFQDLGFAMRDIHSS